MSKSNLPPGVTERMIPGNRPEDQDHEAWLEWLATHMRQLGYSGIEMAEMLGNPLLMRLLINVRDDARRTTRVEMGFEEPLREGEQEGEPTVTDALVNLLARYDEREDGTYQAMLFEDSVEHARALLDAQRKDEGKES